MHLGSDGPDISVIVLSHNRADFVGRTLRSIFGSHMPHFLYEVIFVDDGSNDGTSEVIAPFENKMRVIANKKNLGVGASSKMAVEASRGEFFVRVDSDDFISSDFLHTMILPAVHNDEVELVTCNHLLVDDRGMPQGLADLKSDQKFIDYGAGMIFRKSRVVEVGNYDDSLRFGEDLDLHLRMRNEKFSRFHFPVPLYRRRLHTGNISKSIRDGIARKEIRKRNA